MEGGEKVGQRVRKCKNKEQRSLSQLLYLQHIRLRTCWCPYLHCPVDQVLEREDNKAERQKEALKRDVENGSSIQVPSSRLFLRGSYTAAFGYCEASKELPSFSLANI